MEIEDEEEEILQVTDTNGSTDGYFVVRKSVINKTQEKLDLFWQFIGIKQKRFDYEPQIEHNKQQEEEWPEENANIFSRIFIWWISPLFIQGWSKILSFNNTWRLSPEKTSKLNFQIFDDKLERNSNKLTKTFIQIFLPELLLSLLYKIFNIILILLNPYLLSKLIAYYEECYDNYHSIADNNPQETARDSFLFGIFLSFFIFIILVTQFVLSSINSRLNSQVSTLVCFFFLSFLF